MEENFDDKIFTISEYIKLIDLGLKKFRAKIVGEVSEVRVGPTGHVYFYLKDEEDKSIIKCIIWKSDYMLYGIELREGVKLVASGVPNLHSNYGFSFIAKTIEYSGEGKLKKEYDKLKEKLTVENIFAQERKRSIPSYCQKIGVITSLKGAVIADFSNNLAKFGFKVKMIDSRVDGQSATGDLLASIKAFKGQDIEVLVIMRGGGSLESLQAFNNELLIREVANFPVPVIAAIGHDRDVPLVSLAADLAVSTPSIAAINISQDWKEASLILEREQKEIIKEYQEILNNIDFLIRETAEKVKDYSDLVINKYREAESMLKVLFKSFQNILLNIDSELNDLAYRYLSGFKGLFLNINKELEYAEKIINLNNPERQLNLGYVIAQHKGKIIRKTNQVNKGDDISLRVIDGIIISNIKKINKWPKKNEK